MSNWFTKIYDWATGTDDDDYTYSTENTDKAVAAANEALSNLDTSRSSAADLYSKGQEAAGSAAGNKAGIAKREVRAAALMNGGGKLASAVQGAQAASDAVSEGYDSTAANAANLAASQENAEKTADYNKTVAQANNSIAAAKYKDEVANTAATNKANSKRTRAQNLLSLAGSLKG